MTKIFKKVQYIICFSLSMFILIKIWIGGINRSSFVSEMSNDVDVNNLFLVSTYENEITKEIYSTVDEFRKEFNVPSIQISLNTKDGYINCSSGYADIEKNEKSSIENVYYLGSLTKIYMHAVMLKLVQDNILTLDDQISNYIDISDKIKNITIRNLINHSSGLFDPLMDNYSLFKTYFLGKKWTKERLIKEVTNKKEYFKPGNGRKYSNIGYILLGIVAEKATGKSFYSLLKELYLDPFNLRNTYYTYMEKFPNEKLVTGYDKDIYQLYNTELMANVEKFPVQLPFASLTAGGILGNSKDVCQFLYKLFESNVLEEKYKRMLRLNFYNCKVENVSYQHRSGFTVGYNNYCGYSKSKHLYFVILTNLSYLHDGNKVYEVLVNKIFKILLKNKLIDNI
ncbi:serine hydrolase domain-containing protein [Sporolactobacillus kofuensis]|uniref:Serine hydrolase domain-containing protein n=1 Tax=Sporolactobacillus kofuensis TaxID=269672 RepID=A0ABW1WHK6_9BACL|nr:serine hydrolase [Sporolactobacillus kofuensis]MCO7177104.1 beta-lactamase family protein [Sporolactobacillus kofuensis]